MAEERDKVLETLIDPDAIQTGDYGELLAVRLYPKTRLTRKFVVVAYRELDRHDGFIVTAYLATRLSEKRKRLWTR